MKSTAREGFWWLSVAALITVLAFISTSLAEQRTERDGQDACSAKDLIRGVPHGFRLVSFDLPDRKSRTLSRKARLDIVWTYAVSDKKPETAVLFENIDILHIERPGFTHGDWPILRVTAALTPRQAKRLQLAVACGTVRMKHALGSPRRGEESLRGWDVLALEDRTQAIEASVLACIAETENFERPTLAAPAEVSNRIHGVITIPVKIEFLR